MLANTRMPEPGDVLLGRFRVESIIGQGGMGHVFRATILSNSGPVAIKVLSPEASTFPEAIPRFINEARATTQLKSVHVVKLFDAGTLDNGLPFIVMELLNGHDLAAVLEQRKSLPVKEAVDYVIQASDAIVEAHARGIVHRDLKPSNLFLSGSARQTPIVKVLDFGISKIINTGAPQNVALTGPNTLLGSPHYMSPEQLKSAKDVDARADIWSLGVILYELIGGRAPFDASAFGDLFIKVLKAEYEPLRVQKPQVPEGIDYVIGRCLQKSRDDRFANLTELVQALAPFATPEGTARAQRIVRGGQQHVLAGTAMLADRPSNMLQEMAKLGQLPAPSSGQMQAVAPTPMPGQMSPGQMPGPMPGQMPGPMPGQMPGPMPSPLSGQMAQTYAPTTSPGGMHAPLPAPALVGAPPVARESSPGFAAPSSQPALPITTNQAQQHTIAAATSAQQHTLSARNAPSGGQLPAIPVSSPALPLHYGQQNKAANQAPQLQGGPWKADGPADAQGQRGASPVVVGVGIGLGIFAIIGVVLIVIAMRARGGHDQKNPSPATSTSTSSSSAISNTPMPATATASGEATAAPTPTEPAATTDAPVVSAAPAPPPPEPPPSKPGATAPPPQPPSPPSPPPPPAPHNTGSILNKRK